MRGRKGRETIRASGQRTRDDRKTETITITAPQEAQSHWRWFPRFTRSHAPLHSPLFHPLVRERERDAVEASSNSDCFRQQQITTESRGMQQADYQCRYGSRRQRTTGMGGEFSPPSIGRNSSSQRGRDGHLQATAGRRWSICNGPDDVGTTEVQ